MEHRITVRSGAALGLLVVCVAGCVGPQENAAGGSRTLSAAERACIADDVTAPVLRPHTLNLWPPNHKLHTIEVADCVTVQDDCQSDLRAEFVWASSDEPVDAQGDGHHAPDIVVDPADCSALSLRAERQGPKDGRVYKLGLRVVDAAGNASEAVCTVVVDHDQRGVLGADSGESYRITFDGTDGQPLCTGENPPPAEPPAPPAEPPAPPAEPPAPPAEPPAQGPVF